MQTNNYSNYFKNKKNQRFKKTRRGSALIELIIAMVVSSLVLLAFTKALGEINSHSADPMVYRQMQMIAQSLLEEVQSKDFTKPAGGFSGPYTVSNRALFDTSTDYHNFTMTGIQTLLGTPIPALSSYNAQITVINEAVGTVPSSDSQRIAIIVSNPSDSMTLEGYKIYFDK